MDRWQGKVAVVTGSSGGIGSALVKDLASVGINVVALDKSISKTQDYIRSFPENYGKVYPRECDITKLEDIRATFEWIESELGVVNILVNCAGVVINDVILSENSKNDEEFSRIIDINFKAVVHMTRHAYVLMKKSEDYCMIVNINSVLGHRCTFIFGNQTTNVYAGTKHAITAISEVMRQEISIAKNEKIRVTSISPGAVNTDIYHTAKIIQKDQNIKDFINVLDPSDISGAMFYLLKLPYHVNISELTIQSVGELV